MPFGERSKKLTKKDLSLIFDGLNKFQPLNVFKSFATQIVKHFNHFLQLFDTRLQII